MQMGRKTIVIKTAPIRRKGNRQTLPKTQGVGNN